MACLLLPAHAGAREQLICFMNSGGDDCLNSTDPVASCESRLEKANPAMSVRLSLCEALLDAGEFSRAAVVVDAAASACGSNRALCRDLRLARSNVEEQLRKSQAADPDAARRNQNALRAYCLGRVASEGSVDACAQLLAGDIEDMEITASLGRKLLTLGRPTEALRRYRRVEAQSGSSAELTTLIDEALEQRSVLVASCLRDDDLDDCNAAMLAGEEEEFELYRQQGALLAAARRYSDASLQLAAALTVATDERALARDILRLLPAETGSPNALRVRADAQALLGNDVGALQSYRRALGANPNDDLVRMRLDALLARRGQKIETACVSRRNRAECEALVVSGEPDEQQIRDYLARLDRGLMAVDPGPDPVLVPVLVPVVDPVVVKEPIAGGAGTATEDDAGNGGPPAIALNRYPVGNSLSLDGRTH